ncbi:MAG: 7-cyano-7-deazaguanine synthase [Acidimicrobiales bacterium]
MSSTSSSTSTCRAFGGSALTTEVPVPKHDVVADLDADIPVTYVPARNTVFLSLALALAEVRGADDLFIGVNAVDYSGYPGLPAGVHRRLRAAGERGDAPPSPTGAGCASTPR